MLFVLHNLSISSSFENEYLALVPISDARVQELAEAHATVKRLIDGFTDPFGRKITPAILLCRRDAPDSLREIEALVAFRNIYAVSVIIESWAEFLVRGWATSSPNFSNYFDFYPIMPDKDYEDLITHSPSIRGLDSSEKFVGQCSPELAPRLSNISYDSVITKEILKKWEKRYIKGRKNEWSLTSLFRSLEMAYQASSIPFRNQGTIYDYGSSISLWVSAFEVLVHKKINQVGYKDVLHHIDCSFLSEEILSHKKYRIIKKNRKGVKIVTGVNLAQKIYYQIYSARNDFSHGNPIQIRNLHAFGDVKRYGIICYAPLLYKMVLISQLKIEYDKIFEQKYETLQYLKYDRLKRALLTSLQTRKY